MQSGRHCRKGEGSKVENGASKINSGNEWNSGRRSPETRMNTTIKKQMVDMTRWRKEPERLSPGQSEDFIAM